MHRACPICGRKVTPKDIFRAAFNGHGKAVVCSSCGSVISKSWSEYRSLGWLGIGLGGILGMVNWYIRDFFGSDTSWMYWTTVMTVFVISIIISAAVLYYWFPLDAAAGPSIEGNQSAQNKLVTDSGNSHSNESADNNLTPSGMEWAPRASSAGQLAGRLALLALLIVLMLLAGYLFVFDNAPFSAVLVTGAAALLYPDVKLGKLRWKLTIACSLVILAVALARKGLA